MKRATALPLAAIGVALAGLGAAAGIPKAFDETKQAAMPSPAADAPDPHGNRKQRRAAKALARRKQ